MTQTQQGALERATAIAERDQLHPFPCTRGDTGELIWLVQNRSDPSRHYLLKVSGDTIQCPCLQAQHRGVCAHAAAVCMALQQQQPVHPEPKTVQPSRSTQATRPTQARSYAPTEQERHQQREAERRERALLWTDDKPFSIWKS